MAEALNGTFKAELIEHQGPWRDFDHVERALVQWVAWYNSERLYSALGYVPPDEYEQAYWAQPEENPADRLITRSRTPRNSGQLMDGVEP
ncbi:integrase core domain-containing protein [Actinacidiphila glaucinigra]|uniref:integrase core domain-containing protein n=1 Tax=Actinacidiphila glaucinigra TaxID=235986 RepID=UPI0035D56CE0